MSLIEVIIVGIDKYKRSQYHSGMKDKNAAAQELGRLSGQRFNNMTKEEKSEYFRNLRLKRKDLTSQNKISTD